VKIKPYLYILAHFGEQGSMISPITLRSDHFLLLHNTSELF